MSAVYIMGRPDLSPELQERVRPFWDKVLTQGRDDCWLWKAAVNGTGRGQFRMDRGHSSTTTAPRAAYTLFVGEIPEGMVVMHSCDEPMCVNPRHLSLGSLSDNTQDMIRKGRAHWQRRAA